MENKWVKPKVVTRLKSVRILQFLISEINETLWKKYYLLFIKSNLTSQTAWDNWNLNLANEIPTQI